ncbi:PDZ domain-containing protein [Tunturiibacter gelidoferens]|uniref:Membrane-associated protease RseP (Regulator of RpoE activity) n=3 Tax=Tunturiibacter TaxID=3154218 RepID=A0A7Y9T1D6_9BACT|nr:PDZ domain-containing protein [Edaphobacter lichenicola]MBB5340300.1 membrane-associated protease RseP (regulator of RpoE activity) [Edaphobacter lichenicola]NYF50383.1 membrane-associated protease RseP (regulator of RpoE activity) [Edaphobacter lichenicola]
MKYRRSLGVVAGVVALMAGTTVLHGGQSSLAAQGLPFWSGRTVLGGAMGAGSHKYATQGYLGVETRDVSDDQVGSLRMKEARGAEIVSLDHDGPACKAGMRMHDVILQMNGQGVDGQEQLKRLLRDQPVGRTVSFVISRDGQTMTMTMQMADRLTVGQQAWEQHYTVPAPGSGPSGSVRGGNSFMGGGSTSSGTTAIPKGHREMLAMNMILSSSYTGAQLEVMGPQLAGFFGAEGGAGLLVRSVDSNSPAEQAGLKAGDVVVRVNSIAVSSGTDWTKTIHDNRGRPLPVVVIRDKQEQTLTLTPDTKKRSCVIPGFGLEEFFGETGQYTRELLAKL